jgi:hypothetical protein
MFAKLSFIIPISSHSFKYDREKNASCDSTACSFRRRRKYEQVDGDKASLTKPKTAGQYDNVTAPRRTVMI